MLLANIFATATHPVELLVGGNVVAILVVAVVVGVVVVLIVVVVVLVVGYGGMGPPDPVGIGKVIAVGMGVWFFTFTNKIIATIRTATHKRTAARITSRKTLLIAPMARSEVPDSACSYESQNLGTLLLNVVPTMRLCYLMYVAVNLVLTSNTACFLVVN